MAMNSTGYFYGTREDASNARREARPDADRAGLVPHLQPATIKEVQFPGVYKVATLADDGTENVEIEGVRCFPNTELSTETDVWLVWWPGVPKPVILVAGGNGCQRAVTEWGVLFGDA